MTTYFCSDLHFFHTKVIEFDNRPYETVEEMNQDLIKRWNETVKENDTVYILGDSFMHATKEQAESVLKQLKGKLHYIYGNHDEVIKNGLKHYFKSVKHYDEIYVTDKTGHNWKVILSHYPMVSFNGQHKKHTIHLYGHVHNSEEQAVTLMTKMVNLHLSESKKTCKTVNVGVMQPYMDYRPQPIDVLVQQAYHENRILSEVARLTSESLQGHIENMNNSGLVGKNKVFKA